MDPAPQSHPILSYVLSRLPTLSNPRPASGGGDFDIEQPHVQTSSPRTPSSAGEFDLVERMPGLRHPSVLRAVAVVSAARSSLQLLGPRPDHELVDSSRALITAAAAGDSQITAFAFSKENWGRPKVEVDFLMRLFERVIHDMSVWQEEDGVSIINGTWIFLVCLKFGPRLNFFNLLFSCLNVLELHLQLWGSECPAERFFRLC